MMTRDETELLDLLGEVYNMFAALPVEHPCDMEETVRDIHNLQNRVLARPTYRSIKS